MLPAPAATADPQVTPTSMPSPVIAPVAKPVAPVPQAKPIATPASVAQPKPVASISTTSMPSPQMTTNISNSSPSTPKGPDIVGFVKAAQAKGISTDEIYSYLKQQGYVDSSGAITTTKQAAPTPQAPAMESMGDAVSRDVGNVLDTAKQGTINAAQGLIDAYHAADVTPQDATDVKNAYAGGGLPAAAAQVGAKALQAGEKGVAGIGKSVGGLAQTVLSPVIAPASDLGTRIGTIIGNLVSPDAAEKFSNFLDAHPEVQDNATMMLNIANLAFPEAADKLTAAVKPTIDSVGSTASDVASSMKNTASGAASAVADTTKTGITKARDAITPNPPKPMQTLIDNAKADPVKAKSLADTFNKYVQAAKQSVTEGSEPAMKVAGDSQFKTAMKVLAQKMKASAESANTAIKNVAQKPISGISEIYQNLQDETKSRLGAEYTPIDTSAFEGKDPMRTMDPEQRYQLLNDVLSKTDEFKDVKGGTFSPAEGSGGEMAVNDNPSLSKLADLHETLARLGDNPTAQAVHNVVRRWQGVLEKVYENGKPNQIEQMMEDTVNQLNESLKRDTASSDGGKYADAKADYSRQVKIRNNIRREVGMDYSRSGNIMKRMAVSSPTGNTFQNVATLEKETGVPIREHAIISNFADELAKNPQAKSLLASMKEGDLRDIVRHHILGLIGGGIGTMAGGIGGTIIGGTAGDILGSLIKRYATDPIGKVNRQLAKP